MRIIDQQKTMASPAEVAYRRRRDEILRLPGMIEEVERRLLFKIGYQLPHNAIVVEFGTFLGASLACVLAGLTESPIKSSGIEMISFDGFNCHTSSGLYEYVIGYCRKAGLEDFLVRHGEVVNWRKIPSQLFGKYEEQLGFKCTKLVEQLVDESFKGTCIPENINFLHLDMPKDWKTMRAILISIKDKLRQGALVCFQDYAFELSGELIVAFSLLVNTGRLVPVRCCASSVYYRVSKALDYSCIEQINSFLNRKDTFLADMALTAPDEFKKIPGSRIAEYEAVTVACVGLIAKTGLPENTIISHIETLLNSLDIQDLRSSTVPRRIGRLLADSLESNTPCRRTN